MGIFDKLKGLLRKNEKQVDAGIDKAADMVQAKVPDEHDDKVDKAADMAKDMVDKVDGDDPKPAV